MWDDSLGAGLQMALFDAAGKAAGVPCYRLLGQKVREWCPISWWWIDMSPDGLRGRGAPGRRAGLRLLQAEGAPLVRHSPPGRRDRARSFPTTSSSTSTSTVSWSTPATRSHLEGARHFPERRDLRVADSPGGRRGEQEGPRPDPLPDRDALRLPADHDRAAGRGLRRLRDRRRRAPR